MLKKNRNAGERGFSMILGRMGMALFIVSAINLVGFSVQAKDGEDCKFRRASSCAKTSQAALKACYVSAMETLWLDIGKCNNVAREDRKECLADAYDAKKESIAECHEVFDARWEVCDAVGAGPYLPEGINPDDFAEVPTLDSEEAYFPLKPGTIYTYKAYPEEGGTALETIVVKVKNETRFIEGVKCRVVQDTVYEGDGDEKKIEDTTDWYALQENGDVWYFGEIALNYEDGVINNIDGSWTAGVEGSKPGIIMYADLDAHIGETYRQEFSLGEAEDVAQLIEMVDTLPPIPVSLPPEVTGPYLHTLEYSAFDPGVFEDKYYAPGIGNVLIVKQETGEFEVLVSIESDSAP